MQVPSLLSEEPARSTRRPPSKTIAFELLLDEGSKTRARIPLRVLVNSHDDTESIITTVKNFYGIYDRQGVSFEDENGNILSARYESLVDNSVVYVRRVAPPAPAFGAAGQTQWQTGPGPQPRPSLGEPFQMVPPHVLDHPHSPSRPSSRLARKRSTSPTYGSRGRRSASQQKPGSFSAASRGSSANGSYHDDAANGYSDSDAGRSSVTGSKKARSEQFASAEISMENVVQEGRRGKTLFDSSELPLFVPPQVPITTSTSSISPQRRSLPQEGPSPFHSLHNITPYSHQPLPSPRSYNFGGFPPSTSDNNSQAYLPPSAGQHGHRLRERSVVQPSTQPTNTRAGYPGHGVLPTPDPTVASCISDEDVARQLIALGDMSNFSHGRTSNSTVDDAFSGAADAASSTGATSDSDEYSEDERSPKHRKLMGGVDDDYDEVIVKSELDENEGEPRIKKIKTKLHDGPTTQIRHSKLSSGMKMTKPGKIRANTLPKTSKHAASTYLMKAPTAPAVTGQSRKTSSSSSTLNFQHHLGMDEEDLSSKPRCQRCRKSKKGCDRQRPCGRCKDAGIGIEGCVSEDEGNGRKGRYGRHMGVPVAKNGTESVASEDDSQLAGAILTGMASTQASPVNSKKRKR